MPGRRNQKEEPFFVPGTTRRHALAFNQNDYIGAGVCVFECTPLSVEVVMRDINESLKTLFGHFLAKNRW